MKFKEIILVDLMVLIATIISILAYFLIRPYSGQLIPVTWVTVLGLSMGSFATSFVVRLPNKKMFIKANPHCATCKNKLTTKDLYPVLSYILSKGKCRFCGSVIPKVVFYTETLVALNYVACYFIYGFGDLYIAATTFFFFTIIFTSMLIVPKFFSKIIFASVIASSVGFVWLLKTTVT